MELLSKLPMPDNMTKPEIVDMLLREEYGFLPPPAAVTAEIESCETNFCAGKAQLKKIRLSCKTQNGVFAFPVYYSCPQGKSEPVPCFIHINFRNCVPDRYQPTEEIIDAGYAILSFCYQDITTDDADFSTGLAGIIYQEGRKTKTQCGKIGLWAWAAMRVLDYAVTLPELDSSCISVAGHSRLGKTALLAGALDERFYCAFSNDSGCGGAALARGNTGETIRKIYDVFPYWFCENYEKYADNEEAMPFDQHYLIAANSPHKAYVASAEQDFWACPKNEYLSCIAAGKYYEKQGLSGFIHLNRMAAAGDFFGEGSIGYHMRSGTHYFSREDWRSYIRYLDLHRGN